MSKVPVKVYAAVSPAAEPCLTAVLRAGNTGFGHEEDEPWAELDGDLLRISFEGLYFPLEDVLSALDEYLPPDARGKLDYLDMEAWTLTRYTWGDGPRGVATRSLNQVLEYSGH